MQYYQQSVYTALTKWIHGYNTMRYDAMEAWLKVPNVKGWEEEEELHQGNMAFTTLGSHPRCIPHPCNKTRVVRVLFKVKRKTLLSRDFSWFFFLAYFLAFLSFDIFFVVSFFIISACAFEIDTYCPTSSRHSIQLETIVQHCHILCNFLRNT